MKKTLSLLLAGMMCVGLLAGCGGQNSETQSSTSSTSSTDSSASTTETSESSNKKSIPCGLLLSRPANQRKSLPLPNP